MQSRTHTFGRGAVGGLVAFLGGYTLTWVLAGGRARQLFVSGPLGGAVPDWKAILWVFQDSHFVGTRTPRVIGPGGEPMIGGGRVDTVSLLGVEYLYLLPPLVCLIAGAAIAYRAGATGVRAGVSAGSTLLVGYFALAVVTMLVGQQAGVGPAPFRAAVIAGLGYPAVFGAIGGAVFGVLRGEPDRRPPAGAVP